MEQHTSLRCVNCGTEWDPHVEQSSGGAITDSGAILCPVCEFPVAAAESIREQLSIGAVTTQLSTLMSHALEDGVAPEEIVRVLREELEFAAELAHTGRRVFIQIVDLGQKEGETLAPPLYDRSTVLRSRAVGN